MFELLLCMLLTGGFFFFNPNRIDGDEVYCFHALALLAILSFFMKPVREIPLKRLGAFLIAAMVSLFCNFNWPARAGFINLFVGFFSLKVIAERIRLPANSLGKILIVTGIIQYVFIGLQKFKLDHFYGRIYPELAGTFLNPWLMGCFFVIALPFVFIVHPALCVLLLPLLILSKSWYCLAVGFFVFFMMISPKKIFKKALILAPIAAGCVFIFRGDFRPDRLEVWIETFQYLKNQWMGSGIGSWAHMGFLKANGADNYHWQWAHNEPYQFFFEQGWLGVLALLPIILMFLFVKKPMYRAAFAGIVLLSLAHPIFHFGRLLFLIITILAMILAEKGKDLCPSPLLKTSQI